MRLLGRNAVITGGTTGLGYAVAEAFLAEGASVAVCGRNIEGLADAYERLTHMAPGDQRVVAFPCDVSVREDVARFMAHAGDKLGSIQILVNNAAVLGPTGPTEDVNVDEWWRTVEINLCGVFLTSRAVISPMRSQGYGKIVNLSGGGATSPRPFFSAYAASKAAVVRLTETLAEELRGTGIDVNAVAPGALNTRMLDQTLAAGPERIGNAAFAQVTRQRETGGSSILRAADLAVYLASAAADGITGRLISAPWDPWSDLHERRQELLGTDIYTLRRIVPEDRAKSWG